MATDATTRPHRSSTLRAVVIPETSPPPPLEEPKKDSASTGFAAEDRFDVYSAYMRLLSDELYLFVPSPRNESAATMYELVEGLKDAAAVLKSKTSNTVGLTAGCDLFIRYVTTARQDFSRDFSHHKAELVRQGKEYAETAQSSRDKIAEHAFGFIKEDAVILTHSYSRVVMQALLKANKRKRISVYVTEARPKGLGMKTYNALTAAGIPCTVILDSAVAYCMDKVDLVLVGSEAVVESGGLINAVGTLSMAIIAKAANKPLYALAESYKFLRFFPLSQYDLPIDNSSLLTLPSQKPSAPRHSLTLASPMTPRAVQSQSGGIPSFFGNSSRDAVPEMSQEQIAKNPEVDYTRPDLITLVFSDVGILTPDGISSFLLNVKNPIRYLQHRSLIVPSLTKRLNLGKNRRSSAMSSSVLEVIIASMQAQMGKP
ncbi:translation initiation factor eIF-2B subunit alpha [Tulasnella sp. 408]|nr:translation initiation factor eIF-2B subunit alpha [Tulasnella sp. 408]